jgi:hypothetical protein
MVPFDYPLVKLADRRPEDPLEGANLADKLEIQQAISS